MAGATATAGRYGDDLMLRSDTMQVQVIELDNRGLQPPEPMMRILDALQGLGEDGQVLARNDREPLFLYPHLRERGYTWDTTPLEDGSFRVRIWKDTTA